MMRIKSVYWCIKSSRWATTVAKGFYRITSLNNNNLPLAACVWGYLLFLFLFFFSFSPVAVLLKDDYFVRGAGLPGRFKAEKMEFHWGQNNGSAGSEHSINGRRFPVEVKYSVPTVCFDKCAPRGLEGHAGCWSQTCYCGVAIRVAQTFPFESQNCNLMMPIIWKQLTPAPCMGFSMHLLVGHLRMCESMEKKEPFVHVAYTFPGGAICHPKHLFPCIVFYWRQNGTRIPNILD